MKKSRRILLFSFGIILGCTLVYFTLIRGENRTYWLPGNRVKDKIMASELLYSPHATCIMNCRKITESDVKEILKNGKVNFQESNTHNTACPSYAIDGKLPAGKNIRIIVTTADSLAEVETAIDLDTKKDTCFCASSTGKSK